MVCPSSNLLIVVHVVIFSIELSTLLVITFWAWLPFKLPNYTSICCWNEKWLNEKWLKKEESKVIVFTEGMKIAGHEIDINKADIYHWRNYNSIRYCKKKKKKEPSVLWDPWKKKYLQTNKIVLPFVIGIDTKEWPRISQAIQLKTGRIVPYFKVMRGWCNRFLVIELWLRHHVTV